MGIVLIYSFGCLNLSEMYLIMKFILTVSNILIEMVLYNIDKNKRPPKVESTLGGGVV